MGMTNKKPFIGHSELTDEIYIIDTKDKYRVTDQVMSAVVATKRAIPKADYEQQLKADMVAMLTDIQTEIDELDNPLDYDFEGYNQCAVDCEKIIQQKINSLKEQTDGKCK